MKNASQFSVRILCLFFCLLFLTGCTGYYPGMNKHDSITFYANLKADAFSPCGKKAAYADGRIYYLSSELGSPGIYSMNEAGDDIRLEIPVEDIRAIQIQNGAIYYAGFTGLEKNAAGPYRQFRLFSLTLGGDEANDFLSYASYTSNLRDENVWDFYISKTGTNVLRFVDLVGYNGSSGLSAMFFQNGTAVPLSDFQQIVMYQKAGEDLTNQALLSVACLGDLYVELGNAFYDNPKQTEKLAGREIISVYDASASRIALPNDRLFSGQFAFSDSDLARWFCGIQQDRIIFSNVRGLEAYNLTTKRMSDVVHFAQPECVFSQIDCGDSILVFTQQLRETEFLDYIAYNVFHLNRALSESLYRVDPDTGEKELILTTGRNQSFLYADRQTAVVGGGKTISIYDISADVPELVRTIELRHRIVDRANKVDTAGGWLFLYGFSEETQRDELLEKVYIGK